MSILKQNGKCMRIFVFKYLNDYGNLIELFFLYMKMYILDIDIVYRKYLCDRC